MLLLLLQGHLLVWLFVHPVPLWRQRRQTRARGMFTALLHLPVGQVPVPTVCCGWSKPQEGPRSAWVGATCGL
jgi:hypothetical protein